VSIRPFAPLSDAEWADLSRPRSHRELAREVFDEQFARLRDSGFDPAEAGRVASIEAKLSLSYRKEPPHEGSKSRTDGQLPAGEISIIYNPDRDTYCAISDSNWWTPEATEFNPAREEEHKRFERAERALAEEVADETGVEIDEEMWAENKSEREIRRLESHRIGNKLELGGTKAYRSDEYQLFMCSIFTGHVEQMPNFRRICFIPQVAAMVRAGKVASLEYFLQCHWASRFWTFTSGQRVPLSGLRVRIEQLHKRLNVLNKELRRRYGCELVFRSTELGTIETAATAGKARERRAAKATHKKAVAEAKAKGRPIPVWTRAKDSQFADDAGELERDEKTGELMFHPHAHCVFHSPRGQLPKEEWSEMLKFVWSFWGDHWDDGAIIKDAREACKYVTKSGEMDALTPAELCGLEKALHGLRLVTPMGVLKREIRARKDAGLKLTRRNTPEGSVWNTVEDANRHLSSTDEQKKMIRDKKRQDRLDRLDATNRITNPDTGELVSDGIAHTGAPARLGSGVFCRVVARLAPAAVATPVKEPRVMVMASRGGFNLARVMEHPLTVGLYEHGVQAWSAGRAIRVHESTSTGETIALTLLRDTDERFAPATEPVWEASRPVKTTPSDLVFAN
jgi:hypothetical protein